MIVAVAFVVMMAFTGCQPVVTPLPDPDPVEISAVTLEKSLIEIDTNHGFVGSGTMTGNGIVWTVEAEYTNSDPFYKILKIHTNRYESGSTEQITWFVALKCNVSLVTTLGADWIRNDKGFRPNGLWEVFLANMTGYAE